ncbi:MAG: hypothetical protein AB1640_13445 [bacterium]
MKEARWTLVMTMVTGLLFGCAHQGPILVKVGYQAPAGIVPAKHKMVVGISHFQDARGKPNSVVGVKSKVSTESQEDLVVQGRLSDLVTAGFKEALQKRGYVVKDVPAWQPGGAVDAAGADVLLGGEIKSLWMEVTSKALKVRYKADVKILASTLDVETQVTRTHDLNCAQEREDIKFYPELVESLLSEALSTAVDQLMKGEELKKSP